MQQLNKELKEEFGEDTWYTSIRLADDGGDGQVIADLTKDPNTLQQERWVQSTGFWNKDANITLSVQGADPRSFMFRLDKEVSLPRLGNLIDQSRAYLRKERNVGDGMATLAQVESSNQMNTRAQGIHYNVVLHSKSTGKSYYFTYKLNGSLESMRE